MLIDTHCHLTHERYEDDRPAVLERARTAGVHGVITVASDLDDAERAAGLVDALEGGPVPRPVAGRERVPGGDPGGPSPGIRPWIRTTAGVHPHQAAQAPDELARHLEAFLDAHPGVVAVGECGLDFHYDFSPRPRQQEVFRIQIEVAARRGLPLVVHCREAEAEMAPLVREAGRAGVQGVLHCFPGDLALLEAAVEAEWCVSFTGLVTFRSFDGLESVRRVPPDRYMLETDGPYMAPVPHRGRRNEPAWVPHIRDRVAELRGESPDQVARATTETALRFFGLGGEEGAPGGT